MTLPLKPLKLLSHFLANYIQGKRPLLLAFSGGPDSSALLALLLQVKKTKDFPLHIAHVDHSWRLQSHQEAKNIEQMALKYQLPFHGRTLTAPISHCNAEEKARSERLEFFAYLQAKYDFQAILLAHHGGDLAETVLKRALEGASLNHCSGPKRVSSYQNMTLWRPLLPLIRSEFLPWTDALEWEPIIDITNEQDRFLRGRMRSQLFPFLEKSFGKQVVKPLMRLGMQAAELDQYLHEKTKGCWQAFVEEQGVRYQIEEGLHLFEYQFLVRIFAKKEGIVLSHELVQTFARHLQIGQSVKPLRLKDKIVLLKKRSLTFSPLIPNNSSYYLK